MTKKLISMRASAETIRKLDELAKRWDTNKSEVIAIAIDRIYEKESRTMAKEVDHTVDHYEIKDRNGDTGVLICYKDGTENWIDKSFQMAPTEIEQWLQSEGYDDAPIEDCTDNE